jgi:predicted O-methyltransferase YrrM
MVITKYYSFGEIEESNKKGAIQIMKAYNLSKEIDSPTILELGVERGYSTTAFLQVCEEKGGSLTSVDIRDCSDVSRDQSWIFVKASSIDKDYILKASPSLNDGIDVLYIDTIHKVEHVKKEIESWFPLLNYGAHIFLDDVDAQPYRRGQRKDNVREEIEFDKLHQFILDFYYANEDQFSIEICYGSTGMACLLKNSEKGEPLKEPIQVSRRTKVPRGHRRRRR